MLHSEPMQQRHQPRAALISDAEFLLDPAALFLDRSFVAETVDHHVGTVLREGASNPQPDAGGRACNDGRFPFEHDVRPEFGPDPGRGTFAGRDHARRFAAVQRVFLPPDDDVLVTV